MESRVLVVAHFGRAPHIEHHGALAARRTGPDTVHLVSAMANPLGGDRTEIRLVVEPGARLRLRTVAATVVLPGGDTGESRSAWDLEVGGELDLDPEPMVVAAAASHLSEVRILLADDARIRVRERVQIGRTGEAAGHWSGLMRADRGGVPLLRHRVELGAGSVSDDVLGAPRACVSELRYPEPAGDAAGTTLELASGGSLSTWLGTRL